MKGMITSLTEWPRLLDTYLFLCARRNGIVSQQLRKKKCKKNILTGISHPHTRTHTRACAHNTHAHTHTYPPPHALLITTTRPQDSVAKRIPFDDVGQFPPNGGTPFYIEQKQDVDSLDDWFEYHTDFLPEDLVLTLNSGLGGYVSQRRSIKMPLAAPKTNDECIDRLCDLLTTSCPETQLLLQRNIDRAVIGTFIR